MKNLQALMNRLTACVRDDAAAQRRVLKLMEGQEQAILERQPARIERANAELEAELERVEPRNRLRGEVLDALAAHWGVPRGAVTLASVAERFGPGSEPLLQLRGELRLLAADVTRASRRLAALITMHRQIARDVIGLLLTDENGNPLEREGTLIDARA